MAPEVMNSLNHTIAIDYYAVGVMTYEFMFGVRPYLGRNRREIREKVANKPVQVKQKDIPEGWSLESADFINKVNL